MEKAITDKLKAEHPTAEMHIVRAGGEEVVVKVPGPGEFQRFASRLEAKKDPTGSILGALLFDCRLYPSPEALQSMIDRRPGIVYTLGNEVCKLAGMNLEADSEKL